MTKIKLTTILAATILVAGMFVLMPVGEAGAANPMLTRLLEQILDDTGAILDDLRAKKSFYKMEGELPVEFEVGETPGSIAIHAFLDCGFIETGIPVDKRAFNVENIGFRVTGLAGAQTLVVDTIILSPFGAFSSIAPVTLSPSDKKTNLLLESHIVQVAASKEVLVEMQVPAPIPSAQGANLEFIFVGEKPQACTVKPIFTISRTVP